MESKLRKKNKKKIDETYEALNLVILSTGLLNRKIRQVEDSLIDLWVDVNGGSTDCGCQECEMDRFDKSLKHNHLKYNHIDKPRWK